MNKKIKSRWLRALRSGKYKQGKGALRKEDRNGVVRHCCLGVLCEIYAAEKRVKWSGHYILDHDEILPEEVQKWSGLEEGNPELPEPYYSCADTNDKGRKFTTIARVIEENL